MAVTGVQGRDHQAEHQGDPHHTMSSEPPLPNAGDLAARTVLGRASGSASNLPIQFPINTRGRAGAGRDSKGYRRP